MTALLLGALAVFLAAFLAAYWAIFLRPYEHGMDGLDLTDDDAPSDDSDWAVAPDDPADFEAWMRKKYTSGGAS